MNKYPWWKNLLLLLVLVVAVLYAFPNYFGETPVIQVSSATPGGMLNKTDLTGIQAMLQAQKVPHQSTYLEQNSIIVRFKNTDAQLHAKEIFNTSLEKKYIFALGLRGLTPKWLLAIGARPMKRGLDLRGGIHFLYQVDTDSIAQLHEKGDVQSFRDKLRQAKVRYAAVAPQAGGGIGIKFRDLSSLEQAKNTLENSFPDFVWQEHKVAGNYHLLGNLSPVALQKIKQEAIEQTMTVLHQRVNELGVSEAVVVQEGASRIAVDLPGIQDAAQAKDILGKTATVEFRLVDVKTDTQKIGGAVMSGASELLNYRHNPVLLKRQVILSGASIVHAVATLDQMNGQPIVQIRASGAGIPLFEQATTENVGKPLATVYIETKSQPNAANKSHSDNKITYTQEKKVINIANINQPLSTHFQISGLNFPEAKQLSLLLRAGSLPTAVTIVEEKAIGPSLGEKNIQLGMISLLVGLAAVVVFMTLYYAFFGIIATFGLIVNLALLVAALSLLGATLTFPGIAGMVLTLAVAIDANVLINERIREELRNGASPQFAIHTGYERAIIAIVDANMTGLIVALLLFALGSGSVKGFAITLTIGILTSLLASVVYTRALVNLVYGNRVVKKLSIGIK